MLLFSLAGKEIVQHSNSDLAPSPLAESSSDKSKVPSSFNAQVLIERFLQHINDQTSNVYSAIPQEPLGPENLKVLNNLGEESDGELFCADAINLVRMWMGHGKEPWAVALLQEIDQSLFQQPGKPHHISKKLQNNFKDVYQLAQGKGPWAHRAEFFFQKMIDEVSDPVLLAGFSIGTTAFHLTRWSTLKGLLRSHSILNPVSRQFIGAMAFGAGIAVESAAFNYGVKGLQWALRDIPFSNLSNQEFLGTALTLGLFRSSHAWLERGMRWFQGIPQWRPPAISQSIKKPYRLLQHSSFFAASWGALTLSHQLQGGWGWRYPMAGGDLLTESLGILLQLQLAGKIFQRVQPRSLQKWTARLDQEARWVQHAPQTIMRLLSPRDGLYSNFKNSYAPFSLFTSKENLALATPQNTPMGPPRFHMAELKDLPENPVDRPLSGVKLKAGIHGDLVKILDASPWPTIISDGNGKIVGANREAFAILENNPGGWRGEGWHSVFKATSKQEAIYKVHFNSGEPRQFQRQEIELTSSEHRIHIFKELPVEPSNPVVEKNQKTPSNQRMLHLMKGAIHDARNHLTVVHSFFEFAFPQIEPFLKLNPQWIEVLESGHDAKLAVKNMLSQMKAIMNLSIGLQVPLQPISLKEFMEFIVQANGFTVLSKRHQIINLSPNVSGVIQGNQTILMSCIGNLIKNSVDAMPRGGAIQIKAVKEGSQVRLTFRDQGSGIPPEHLDKIMNPEFTTKAATKGYGMGLFMVRTLVEDLMHGKIEIDSQVGTGTRVSLIFPLGPEPVSKVEP